MPRIPIDRLVFTLLFFFLIRGNSFALQIDSLVVQWVREVHSGKRSSFDVPIALATDASGNVFVTGKSEDAGTAYDFLTVKYDQHGNEVWSARYDGWQHGFDIPVAIATDAAGNVYVAGISDGPDSSLTDIVTIKYGNTGSVRWIARYNGPVSLLPWGRWYPSADAVTDIAVDNNGNVYVCGHQRNGWYNDFITVKYNANGIEEWANAFDGNARKDDKAMAMALDPDDNILVAGWTTDSTDFLENYATIKYSPYGDLLWSATNNIQGYHEVSKDIVADNDGSVYVTGDISAYDSPQYKTGYSDLLTIRYSSNGELLWSDVFDSGEIPNSTSEICDFAIGIGIDGGGDVYVAALSGSYRGSTYQLGDSLVLIKYGQDGARNWIRYHDNGDGEEIRPAGLAVGLDGASLLAFYGDRSRYGPFITNSAETVHYGSNGNLQWETYYPLELEEPTSLDGLELDPFGKSLVITPTGSEIQSDFQVRKYSSTGNEEWVTTTDGEGNVTGFVRDATLDQSGNIYVAAVALDSTGKRDVVTAKFSSTGQQLWSATYKGAAGGDDEPLGIEVDADGSVYMSGNSVGIETGMDYLTVKYNADGSEGWVSRFNNSEYDFVSEMRLDSSGNIVVGGYPSIAKYDPNGLLLWSTATPSSTLSLMEVDDSGNIITVQYEWGNGDHYLMKYDPLGVLMWQREITGYYPIDDLMIDDSENIYLTSGASYSNSDSTSKFDSSGNRLWALGVGGTEIKMSYDGSVYVANDEGWPDDWLHKIAPQGTIVWSRAIPQLYSTKTLLGIDGEGQVYITGIEPGEDYQPGLMRTYQYNPSGEQTWSGFYDDNGRGEFRPGFLEIDSHGNVHLIGEKVGKDFSSMPFVLKYAENGIVSSADLGDGHPHEFSLAQNYPNPFNGETSFRLQIADYGLASLVVFDLLGQHVATILNEPLAPGTYTRRWDAAGLPSGVYFYRLQSGNFVETKKLVLLR